MRAVFPARVVFVFYGGTGYVFSAFLLLFTGIYTMVYNLQSASVHFEYVLGSMSFVFLIIVPILTMRVLAEERRQKTDQLLYSLPLTMTQVVLGKFAAMLVVFAAPMAVICLYPVVLSAYGQCVSACGLRRDRGILLLRVGAAGHRHVYFLRDGKSGRGGGTVLCGDAGELFPVRPGGIRVLHGLFVPGGAGGDGVDRLRHRVSDDEKRLRGPCFWRRGWKRADGAYLWDSSRFEGLFPQIISQLTCCHVLYHP